MEAEAEGRSHQHHHHQRGLQFNLSSPGIPGLDVVRALHQTVISLRSALDSSREELRRLKECTNEFPEGSYAETVERLTLENHILRRRILAHEHQSSGDVAASTSSQSRRLPLDAQENKSLLIREASNVMDTRASVGVEAPSGEPRDGANADVEEEENPRRKPNADETTFLKVRISTADDAESSTTPTNDESLSIQDTDRRQFVTIDSSVEHLDLPDKDAEELSLKSASDGDNSVFSDNPDAQSHPKDQQQQRHLAVDHTRTNDQSENDSEELDDIELIFTTDDTCRDLGLQEDLVSITEAESENWRRSPTATGQQVPLKHTKSASESVEHTHVCNGEKTSSVDEAASSQSSSIDREESVDRFDESSNTRLNKMWSQCSVLVETDISKCGVLEEPEHSARHAIRRNTLAAPPTAYRPIMHREALAAGRRKGSTPLRPVMDRSCGARRESGAQTDISALPAQWRSESYLAHKVAHTFTTLPSKFALPAGMPGRLRLSDKTREARRVMLSDISFTSMVPELSRSADHLCHDPHSQACAGSRGCGLRTPDVVHRRESLGSHVGYWPRCCPLTSGALTSPSCDCRLPNDLYSSRYRGSLTSLSIPSPGLEVASGQPCRRHSWRATAASFDTWRVPTSASGVSKTRPTWSSMPSSPTHPTQPSKAIKSVPKRTRSKITFQDCPMTRGSVPNLRSELNATGENSGGSTESLIDEAEDFLRRSIDSMLTITSVDYWGNQCPYRKRRVRRHSEPDLVRDWNPSQLAKPYLPKAPGDLKIDHLVKVISPEGSVLQGRVRYVGPILGRDDIHVGVELPYESGHSDGTFHGRRFFDCEPGRAIFVPFKKVVLAWCTT